MLGKQHEDHIQKGISPVAAGLTGVVIGAAGFAAVALAADEGTRKKATKKATQIKDDLQKWSTKTMHELQQKGQSLKSATQQKVEETMNDTPTEITERPDKIDLK